MFGDLLALSVRQPFASALVAGVKRIENRGSPIFDVDSRGRWVPIHAAKAWYPSFDPKRAESRREDIREDHLEALAWLDELWPGHPPLDTMPLGSLLGVVHVSRVYDFRRSTDDVRRAIPHRLGPWATGPVCIQVDRAIALPSTIPCKGALGLWRVPAEHVPALRALLPEGA